MAEKYFTPEIETMPRDEIKKLQSERLVKQIKNVYENVEPYRKKMEPEKIIQILRQDAEAGQLTKPVVECLIRNYEYVDRSRDENSRIVGRHYYETFGDNS